MCKLTKFERLQLINQFSILKELSDDEFTKDDFETKIKILENGFERRYADLTDYLSEPMAEEECVFVNDVLDFYEDVHFSFNKLDDKDKTDVLNRKVKFKGFDLNDSRQSRLYSYADFMINDYGGWNYLKQLVDNNEIEINSHGSEVPESQLKGYLERYKTVRNNKLSNHNVKDYLTKEELESIFDIK